MAEPEYAPTKAKDLFPRYTLRRSLRSKYLRISITPRGDVEVVLPRRATVDDATEFVRSKHDWILKQLAKIQKHRPLSTELSVHDRFPKALELRAIDEIWHVHYEPNSDDNVQLKMDHQHKTLMLKGQTHDAKLCQHALTLWLKNKAKKFLTLQIHTLATKHHLPFERLSIRNQKTRWGSCSAEKAITLNFKMIFFPKELVQHVILHELCHTVHLDHSAHFWKLLTHHDSHTPHLRKELKIADRYVPIWLYT